MYTSLRKHALYFSVNQYHPVQLFCCYLYNYPSRQLNKIPKSFLLQSTVLIKLFLFCFKQIPHPSSLGHTHSHFRMPSPFNVYALEYSIYFLWITTDVDLIIKHRLFLQNKLATAFQISLHVLRFHFFMVKFLRSLTLCSLFIHFFLSNKWPIIDYHA